MVTLTDAEVGVECCVHLHVTLGNLVIKQLPLHHLLLFLFAAVGSSAFVALVFSFRLIVATRHLILFVSCSLCSGLGLRCRRLAAKHFLDLELVRNDFLLELLLLFWDAMLAVAVLLIAVSVAPFTFLLSLLLFLKEVLYLTS